MDGITEVRPYGVTDPAFEEAFHKAEEAGVEMRMLCCHVEPDSLVILPEVKNI